MYGNTWNITIASKVLSDIKYMLDCYKSQVNWAIFAFTIIHRFILLNKLSLSS